MKYILKYKIKYAVLAITVLLFATGCETDFDNPNAVTEEQAFSSREGIIATTVGMQQVYSTSGVRWMVETPAVTTREAGITTTFQNMIELEDGGTDLPNFNSNVKGMWSTMLSVMRIAEEVEANTPSIELEAGTTSGLIAYAKLFKAMCIANLAQSYDQVVVQTNPDNNAVFVSRAEGMQAAITLLTEAQALIAANPISDEFVNEVTLGNIDVENTINAMLARINLFAGNYDAAITAANNVDANSASVFAYDTQNVNPIWNRVNNNNANFKPRDNFGLPAQFVFDPTDGRLSFYLIPLNETNQNGLPIENLAGFFDNLTKSIPVYIPDEMLLIIAEANLRKASPDMAGAVVAINKVLTDTTDIFGINANVAPYAGAMTVPALLDEVYRNRRAELFLIGTSLEDSRRFDRQEPTSGIDYSTERNRNFYPFPDTERNSNPNTPTDPSI